MSSLFNAMMGAAGVSTGGYQVDNSAVLNDGSSQRFTRTPSSAASERIGTFSMWVKRGVLGTNQMLFSNERDDGAGTAGVLEFQTDDQLRWKTESTVGANIMVRETTQVFRDPHLWIHIMVTWNSNNTDDTCASVWINGQQVSDFATKTNFGSAQDLGWPSTSKAMNIGAQYNGSNYSDVYLSEFVYLDGTASSNATDFGEYENGVWRPISVSDSISNFGTNGFYLDFADSSNLGNDVSGNNNDFTNNNSVTQADDTPSNSFAVVTPLSTPSGVTFSNGNLQTEATSNWYGSFGSIALTSGKWYWEVDVGSATPGFAIGVADAGTMGNQTDASRLNGWTYGYDADKKFDHSGTGSSYAAPSTPSANDVFMVALDMDNGEIYVGQNGTWLQSSNPATGTSPMFSNLLSSGTGKVVPAFDQNTASNAAFHNFGGGPSPNSGGNTDANGYGDFDYAPPSGFLALNTANLNTNAAPAVADVSDGFVQTTNTEANIVSALASARSAHTSYIEIYKNLDAVEEWVVKFSDDTGNFLSFNDNDAKATFPTLAGSNVWLGASLRVGSTYGVYTATVSHTNGSDTDSAHGMTSSTGRYACIVKRESTGGGDWYLDHPALTSGYNIVFGSASAAVEQNSTVYADVDATNGTVLSAAPTGTYRVIVFAEVPGFLELPDWTGNSSSNGPLVNLALGPTFGIFKTYKTTTGDWIVHSTAVDDNTAAGNPRNTRLILNGTQSDSTDYAVDYGANFFKVRDSQNAINASVPMLGILIGQASFGATPATAS